MSRKTSSTSAAPLTIATAATPSPTPTTTETRFKLEGRVKECRCPKPAPFSPPAKAHTCCRCGFWINPTWGSTDENVNAFFGRLEESTPSGEWWLEPFVDHCKRREHAGRKKFGLEYLVRDNPAEGLEEACDGALYAHLDVLQAKRAGNDDDMDAALTAAYHFGKAYEALLRLREKRHGAP